jgi:hypothetical protein
MSRGYAYDTNRTGCFGFKEITRGLIMGDWNDHNAEVLVLQCTF